MKNVAICAYFDGQIWEDVNTLPLKRGDGYILVDGDLEAHEGTYDILARVDHNSLKFIEGDILKVKNPPYNVYGEYGVIVYDPKYARFVVLGIELQYRKAKVFTALDYAEKVGNIFYDGVTLLPDKVVKRLHQYFNTIDKKGHIMGRD